MFNNLLEYSIFKDTRDLEEILYVRCPYQLQAARVLLEKLIKKLPLFLNHNYYYRAYMLLCRLI
jgi:hypothetical protein